MRTDLLAASNLENDDSYVLKKSQEKSLLKLLITKLLSKNKFWQKILTFKPGCLESNDQVSCSDTKSF